VTWLLQGGDGLRAVVARLQEECEAAHSAQVAAEARMAQVRCWLAGWLAGWLVGTGALLAQLSWCQRPACLLCVLLSQL
jgi:hypothetical protein